MFDKRSEKSPSRFVSAATLFGKNEIRGTLGQVRLFACAPGQK